MRKLKLSAETLCLLRSGTLELVAGGAMRSRRTFCPVESEFSDCVWSGCGICLAETR